MSGKDGETLARRSFLDKFHLAGKVALVTGGSRGIGRSIALGLAEAGADIVLAARKLPDLEQAAQEITRLGRRALPVSVNIGRLPDIDKLVKKAMAEFRHIDIMVNNAATNVIFGSVFDIDEKAWDVTMGLNLKGYFFLSQAVGRVMREQGGGSIINVSSKHGVNPGVGLAVYSISKAGVNMLTQVLAQEWGQYNIRVNAIVPGSAKTRLAEALINNPEFVRMEEGNTALGRLAEPDEMANAAIFLASDASSYMTGQTIVLDGGYFPSLKAFLSLITPKIVP